MKSLWLEHQETYDGCQLQPLRNYLQHGLLGDSVIAWVGPCNIPRAHIVDGEDLRDQSEIRGDKMLHFIFELFHADLTTAVVFQRLFTSIIGSLIYEKTGKYLRRSGDDLYLENKKFNISIAAPAINSQLIHTALNVVNTGAPVPICSLEDFKLSPEALARECMQRASAEWMDLREATLKVRPLFSSTNASI